jgi:serine/threonine protein kinase/tetratricopeptide (TPR) repeat protein
MVVVMNTIPHKAKDIFVELVSNVPLQEWDERLEQACQGDDELRNRVRALLRAHAEPGSFLEQPAVPNSPPRYSGEGPGEGTIDSQPISERPGTVIGPYKLLQQIGEGGMGVVFMAEQTEPLQRTVALKIIKPGMDTRQVIARFEAERQALAMMDHSNIAKVLDAGTTENGRPFFVMELVKGVPITKYCDEKQLSLRDRLELFKPVCEAVQHAHQKGIIHRDIKPTNVLVAEYDNHAVPKVIDFGVAKATAQKLTERTMFTEFGQVIGTVEYMSPEQAKLNQLDIDTRSDIYSLGVLLYELLTGSTPFEQKRLREAAFDEALRIIREEEPPKPSTRLSSLRTTSDSLPLAGRVGEGVPTTLASIAANRHTEPARLSKEVSGELDWIVMKCLEKYRSRRYESASGLAADLQHHMHDEPVQAGPPSASYKLRKLARRHRTALRVALAFLTLLVVATAVSTWQAVRATHAKSEALAQKQRANEQAAIAEGLNQFFSQEVFGLADPNRFDRANIKLAEALDVAASKIDSRFPDDPRLRGFIRDRFGEIYIGLDRPQKAVEQLQKAYELRLGTAGAKDSLAMSSRSRLGWALYKAGRFTDGRDVLEAALADETQVLGAGHPDTVETACHLSVVLLDMGDEPDKPRRDLDVARNAHQQARVTLGPRHLLTLNTQSAIAWSLRRQGKPAEALEPAREATIGLRETRGRDDLDTMFATYNYAMCLIEMQPARLDEAVAELEPLLASRNRVLGPSHHDTLWTTLRMADSLRAIGKPERALAVLEDMRTHLEDIESARTWRRGVILCLLGRSYEALGRYERAAEFYAAAGKMLDAETDDQAQRRGSAWWLHALARSMVTLPAPQFRDPQRAVELAKKAFEFSPGEATWWTTLGVARYRNGDFKQAVTDLEKSIQLRQGGDSVDYFFLSMAHRQLGNADEARKWYDQAVQWMVKNQPGNEELRHFRAEAEELLKITDEKPTTKAESK